MAMFSTLNGIMGGGGGFKQVQVGGTSVPQIYLSQDGKSYSSVTTGTGSSGLFALDLWINMRNTARFTDDDGVNWQTGVITGATPTVLTGSQRVAFDGTTIVFADSNGSNNRSIVHSSDGKNFTQASTGGGAGISSHVGHNASSTNPWVITVSGGGALKRFSKSNDGLSWTSAGSLSIANALAGLFFDGSRWIATVNGGASFIESTDGGATWSTFANGIDTVAYSQFGEIVFAKGLYVLNALNNSTNKVTILTSPDFVTWTERTLPGISTGGSLLALNYSNNLGLFTTCGVTTGGAGVKGVVYYSTNAQTWFESSLSVSAGAQLEYVAVRG